MPQQLTTAVENNFTKGLITEATGLNFPENAATETDNCTYTLIGDVTRRGGIDFELNGFPIAQDRTGRAMSSYKWNNAGGDGNTQLVVEQIGESILFFRSSTATVAAPLSIQFLVSIIPLTSFIADGGTLDVAKECQFSDGNGYLFIYHPSCDPIYCTYNAGTIVGNRITVQIRDFIGVPDNLGVNVRPTALTIEHNYNLINQGWVAGNPWSTVSFSVVTVGLGAKTFIVASGLPVVLGDQVTIINNHPSPSSGGLPGLPGSPGVSGGLPVGPMMSGNVTAYTGTSMTINVTSGTTGWFGLNGNDWLIVPRNTAYISSWFTSIGNYPSNSDVWWYFKNGSGVFDPATTLANVSLGAGKGPSGHFVLDAFSQQRDVASGLGVTDIQTTIRPKTGTWFQGRVWYTGVDAQQAAVGDAGYYSWSENIYFSQIVNNVYDFGHCYQVNDPTSENLFDLLPTDGGVITIQSCGSIFKLFPIQNGMLVFASNGVWFITGSKGIGFAADDYTIQKLSSVRSTSSTSFVDVLGLPYFWNEEGIYSVQPQKEGGLSVVSQTYSTIDTFYSGIPTSSKKYVRGDYDPINYVIQWVYRSTEATDVATRYEFDKILNYNTANKAFYPYTISSSPSLAVTVNGIIYVSSPGGSTAPAPVFKYFVSKKVSLAVYNMIFAEERNFDTYLDWVAAGGSLNYDSHFITGYKLRGQGIKKFQPQYIQVWSRMDEGNSGYKIQGVWDYSIHGNSGKWSSIQNIELVNTGNFSMVGRRHKIRGSGYSLQFKIISKDSLPFDIAGWAVVDTVNQGT